MDLRVWACGLLAWGVCSAGAAFGQFEPVPPFNPGPPPAPAPFEDLAPGESFRGESLPGESFPGEDRLGFPLVVPAPTPLFAEPLFPLNRAPDPIPTAPAGAQVQPIPAPRPRSLPNFRLPFVPQRAASQDAAAVPELNPGAADGETAADELVVSARMAQTWEPVASTEPDAGAGERAAAEERVSVLRGPVTLRQGDTTVSAPTGVLWRRPSPTGVGEFVTVYLEGGVKLDEPGRTDTQRTILLKLAPGKLTLDAPETIVPPGSLDPLRTLAEEQRELRGAARRTARLLPPEAPRRDRAGETNLLTPPAPGGDADAFGEGAPLGGTSGVRRLQLLPRSAVNPSVKSFESEDTLPAEQVTVVSGGVRLIIDGLDVGGGFGNPVLGEPVDQISLAAENVVIWTRTAGAGAVVPGVARVQPADFPLTVYLEGDIEIRQGRNVIHAQRAVYDVKADRGLLLDAELSTIIEGIGPAGGEGTVRVKARELRQLAENNFRASNAWTSTSEFGFPGYRFESRQLFIEPRYDDVPQPGKETVVNPATGQTTTQTNWLRAYENRLILNDPRFGDVPVLYTPYLAGPAEDPNIPVRNIRFGNSDEFGTELEVTL